MDTLTAALRSWLSGWEGFGGRLNLDRLAGEPGSAALLTAGEDTETEHYLFAVRRKRSYQLVWECEYGSDPVQNQQNLDSLSALSAWIRAADAGRTLPGPDDDRVTLLRLTVPDCGRLLAVTADGRAEYGITVTAEYLEKIY